MAGNEENSVWKLIKDLADKKGISEIVINGPKIVFVERGGQFIQLKANLSKNDIYTFIDEISKFNRKPCNANEPILDGNLPDGSRINIITEPFVKGCPAITIRKYLRSIKTFDTAPNVFGLDKRWVSFFKSAILGRTNIIVSGGTGVGKTTFMNLLLNELNPDERIVTLEDTLELTVNVPNVVRLESRGKGMDSQKSITLRDLVKNTLRMRPDRIVVGEVRGEELFDLLQAMNTGHNGSMSTIHANSPAECMSRMETLFLLSGYDVPHHVVRRQISSAVDFVIQLTRLRDGRRIVSQISELTGMEGDNVLMQNIAHIEDGVLKDTGVTPKCLNKLHDEGGLPMDFFNV